MQELVVESLVVSLAMVVVDVLAHEETQVPFAEGDDATETLLLNRADEPLGIRVEIGTLRRETDRLDTPVLQDLAKTPRGEPVGGELLLSPQSVEIIKFGDPGSGR